MRHEEKVMQMSKAITMIGCWWAKFKPRSINHLSMLILTTWNRGQT